MNLIKAEVRAKVVYSHQSRSWMAYEVGWVRRLFMTDLSAGGPTPEEAFVKLQGKVLDREERRRQGKVEALYFDSRGRVFPWSRRP